MLWFAAGPLVLAVVWLGAILYLRRFSLWMIWGGFAFCCLLWVLGLILTSAAGSAASWDGATAADRAGGRGFAADAGFILFGNGFVALICWLGLAIITMIGVGVQALMRTGTTETTFVATRADGRHRSRA
jgi:hypothetical protein